MSKKEKLIEKIKNNPKTVRFEEIDKILLDIGFVRTQPSKGSSHYTYHFENLTITIPYKRPYIKVVYVKQIIKLLDILGY
ncbi:type II toxin-antitoxin system HicA family toxin [Thermoanaerobacterium saccharolyticum]|uniref:type II toxin-antitoxin system HicA family toxin n=1 Tax=Thermoanaerobacterium saccharolyticum TaxID=28896 RepID=UPI002FD9EA53